MQLNSDIWGAPATYVNATGGDIWGEFWRTEKVYADILYDNPALRYPQYETSSYRWGIPADCSVGHFSTCSWWADNGVIKHEIKEPLIKSVIGFTFNLNRTTAYSGWRGSDTYADTVDSYFKYPPYQKMQVTLQNVPGSISWTGASSQPCTYQLKFYNYQSYWTSRLIQCAKYNYAKNVILLSASWINLKGNYSNNVLVEASNPAAFTGELDTIISHMRSHYNADISGGKAVTPEDYAIIGIGGDIYTKRDSISRVHPQDTIPFPVTFPGYEPSQRWKSIYYQDTDLDAVALHNSNRQLSIGCGSSIQFNPTIISKNLSYIGSYSSLPTPTTFYNGVSTPYIGSTTAMLPCDQCLPASSKKQVFSDVSYHWEWHLRRQYRSFSFAGDVPNLPTSSTSAYDTEVSIYPVLVIDNYDTQVGDYFDACRLACLHEMSFYGLPLCTNYTAATSAMWTTQQESIFIPQFDSHFVTTGNFVTLKKSYELDPIGQYDWGDIFAADAPVNDYDPSYQPTPEHGEDDFGNLENRGAHRVFPTTLNIYKLNITELVQFLHTLNSLYINQSGAIDEWTIDFKGTNPTDYIVGAYATLYDVPQQSNLSDITLGVVNFHDLSDSMQAYKADIINSSNFDCGSVFFTPYYGDFRDYSPYTTAELYLPLCGTVNLDVAFFINHYINVVYWFDIVTMSCAASIYRDGITLYKTVSGSIGAQIPLLAANMGDYQNSIHQIETAQKQNEIRIATSAITTAASAAAIIAAPETGGLSLAAGAGIIAGVGGIAKSLYDQSDLQYKLEHKAPSYSQTSAASPQNDFCVGDIIPKLYIKRSKMLSAYDPATYAHVVGNACCIAGTIGSFSGYTVVGSCDLSGIQATQSELDQIRQLLQIGVYL